MRGVILLFGGPLLFVTSAMTGTLAFYVRAVTDRREWLAVLIGVAAIWYVANMSGPAVAQMSILGGYAWFLAVAFTVLVPFIQPAQIPGRAELLRWMVGPPAILVILVLALNHLGQWLSGPTLDASLFHADASLGIGQPAFTVAAWSRQFGSLGSFLSQSVYIQLPLAAMLVYVSLDRQEATRYALGMALVVVLGGLCYQLVPGVGTLVTFGEAFPLRPPSVFAITTIPIDDWPRNCFPSVHLSAGLLMAWSAPRRYQWLAWLYLLLMAGSTLIDGGHYLVDLIGAVPFTLAIWSGLQRRWLACGVGVAVFALWVTLLRLDAFASTPAVATWSLTALTVLVSTWAAQGSAEHNRSADVTFRPCAVTLAHERD